MSDFKIYDEIFAAVKDEVRVPLGINKRLLIRDGMTFRLEQAEGEYVHRMSKLSEGLGIEDRGWAPLEKAQSMLFKDERLFQSLRDCDTNRDLLGFTKAGVGAVWNLTEGREATAKEVEGSIVTLRSSVTPVEGDCPVWDRFLWDAFAGDQELIRFVELALATSLSGRVGSRSIYVLRGKGGTGKSLLTGLIQAILGEDKSTGYGDSIDPKVFMGSTGTSDGRSEMTFLRGKRFAAIHEVQDRKLDVGLLKRISGGDPMTARLLYGEVFTYQPQATLWLTTNGSPDLCGDDAMRQRVRVIPMDHIPEKPDLSLDSKLRKEAGQIFHRLLLLAKTAFDEIKVPEAVERATRDLFEEAVPLIGFCDEWIRIEEGSEIDGEHLREMLFMAGVYKRDKPSVRRVLSDVERVLPGAVKRLNNNSKSALKNRLLNVAWKKSPTPESLLS